MSARTAILLAWCVFAAAVALVVLLSGLAAAQSSAICNEGMCVVPQKDLLDLLYYLQHLQKLAEGKCA